MTAVLIASNRTRMALLYGAGAALLLLAVLAALGSGAVTLAPGAVWDALWAGPPAHPSAGSGPASGGAARVIVWELRLPRALVGALVGAALSVAGAQMQGLFRNPLADPGFLGTSAGAGFGAVLMMAVGLAARSPYYVPLGAVAGALGALAVVTRLARLRGDVSVATLLLVGVALNSLVGAGTQWLLSAHLADFHYAREMLFWLLGGLTDRTWRHAAMIAPCVVLGLAWAGRHARALDLLLEGEESAAALGVEPARVRRAVLANAALLVGAAVAVSGVVGFVGLMIPHLVRLLTGPAHRRLLPAAALTGAWFLVAADVLARRVRPPEELNLGIVTASCGAPFFLFLLWRHRRHTGWET